MQARFNIDAVVKMMLFCVAYFAGQCLLLLPCWFVCLQHDCNPRLAYGQCTCSSSDPVPAWILHLIPGLLDAMRSVILPSRLAIDLVRVPQIPNLDWPSLL